MLHACSSWHLLSTWYRPPPFLHADGKQWFESVGIRMITLREVEDRDILRLAELLPKGFAHTTQDFWLQRFDLWWARNPAYTPQIPRGWVLDDGTKLVGFIGNIPVTFLVHGEKRIGAASSSWYVDPSVRGLYSIRLFTEFMKQKSASLFLFKAEEEYVMNFLTKFKFEEYILPTSQKEYVYILNKKQISVIFLKFIFSKQIPKLSEIPELYKRLCYLKFGYLLQKPVVHPGAGDPYTSSICTSCDDAFLRIGEPYVKSCDVIVSHDTNTLNWLYFSSARWFTRVVIQCRRSQDNTLAGYMVFDIERRKPSEAGSMRLMEMHIEDADPRVLSSLTTCAVETGKQNNAALLVVWANSPETEAYFRSTFFMRKTIRHYRYLKFSDTPEMRAVREDHGKVCPSLIYPPQ